MHISHLCFVLYYQLTLAVAVFIFHGQLYVDTCSVELPIGGVHAMNKLCSNGWRIEVLQSLSSVTEPNAKFGTTAGVRE